MLLALNWIWNGKLPLKEKKKKGGGEGRGSWILAPWLTPSLPFLTFKIIWVVETTFLSGLKFFKVLCFKLKIIFGFFWNFERWTLAEVMRLALLQDTCFGNSIQATGAAYNLSSCLNFFLWPVYLCLPRAWSTIFHVLLLAANWIF